MEPSGKNLDSPTPCQSYKFPSILVSVSKNRKISMGKKSGIGSLLAGIALGAAAVFFSKKENRDQTVAVAKKAKSKAKQAVKMAKVEGKKIAKAAKKESQKVVRAAKTETKKVKRSVKKIAKK